MRKLLLALPLIGGLISRFHGGGFYGGFNKSIKNLLWAVPFAITSAFVISFEYSTWYIVAAFVAALILCAIGKATGHGGGIDLATSAKEPGNGRTPERLEFLILWRHGKMKQYWYDALLLAIVGLAAVSGGVLVLAFINPAWAVALALGGMMKSVGYMIGWKIFPGGQGDWYDDFNEATEIGEFLTGVFAYSGLSMGILL